MLDLKEVLEQLEQCSDQQQIQSFHADYLWKKWKIAALYQQMKDLSPEEKKAHGQKIQELSASVNNAFEAKQNTIKSAERNKKLESDLVDISLLESHTDHGHLTLLSQARRRVEDIFRSMWYIIETGHHVVSVEENFESVNIPATHPATEMHDTLYLNEQDDKWRNLLMRTHTSAHQTALIKKHWTPGKFVVPWKVCRNEKMDSSHDCVFWQIEWVVIDRHIWIAHFKSEMRNILEAILEDDSIEMRLRPWYFPFVEPWFEIDAKYKLKNKEDRLEILWAWMIHPNVLKNADLDPNEWSWFAFGIGLTRLVAIKYWIQDIRLLTNADARFVKSF